MSGALANDLVHRWLGEIADSCYIGLHFDSPFIAGAYASEISGSGYVRVRVTFTEPSSRSMWSVSPAIFSGLPQTRVTWLSGWDEIKEGNMLFACEMAPVIVATGGGISIPVGQIAVSLA